MSHSTPIAKNQQIIWTDKGCYFKSYDSIVAFLNKETGKLSLVKGIWDISATTLKYLKRFIAIEMGEYITQKKTIEEKIASGEYVVLNSITVEGV